MTNPTTSLAANKLLTPQTGTLAVAPNPTGGQGLALRSTGKIHRTLLGFIVEQDLSALSTFTIPSGFRHLRLEGMVRSTVAANEENLFIYFNGDTGTTYDYNIHYSVNGTASASTVVTTSSSLLCQVPGNSANASAFGSFVVNIPYYNQVFAWKTWECLSRSGLNTAAVDLAGLFTGTWRNTARIKSLSIVSASASAMAANSLVSLYGVP